LGIFGFSRKQYDGDIAATVPLISDPSRVVYPSDNYANFSSQGYGRSEIVHACIRELSTGTATARWFVGIPADGGISEIENSPFSLLLKYPNPEHDWYTWLERAVTYLQVAGNVYVYKERVRTNRISALWLLRPDRVSIVSQDRGASSYSYEINGKEYEIPASDIAHLSLPNPSGDVYGLSPLHVLAKTVNLDTLMTDFAKTYFNNAGVPSGLLKIKRRLTSQEEASRIRSRWRSTFGGPSNMHQVAVLDDDAEYQQMASSPKDMALTELHNLTESRICSVFGVPPILISANVGLQRSTFSNYREARFSFHSETLEPLINRFLRFFNYCLVPEFPNSGEVMVDLSEMRSFLDDKDSVTTRATNLFTAGIITLNEARSLVGQDAIDDGDVRRVPVNIIEDNALEDGPAAPLAIEEGMGIDQIKRESPVAPGAVRLRRSLLKDRDALVEDLDRRMQSYLRRIKNRADGVMGRYMERDIELEEKEFPFEWGQLVPDAELDGLSSALHDSFVRVTKSTFGHINDSGVAGVIEWAENLPAVQMVVSQATARATIIHRTTKKVVRETVETALTRGYSVDMLARGVPRDKFPGLKSILNETRVRAKLIARTEVMRAQNQTSVNFFREQGFQFVRATDPDGDEGDNYVDPGDPYGRTCIERDGQVYHVGDAMDIQDHPNGTLSWQPMDRNYRPATQEV